jgi:tetratricopeptide (TPR) repeat protein
MIETPNINMSVTGQSWRKRPAAIGLTLVVALALTGCARTPAQQQARFLGRGQKALVAKDYRRAALEFRNAIQANPREAEPYYQLALADIALSDYRGAVAALLSAVDRNPKHFGAQLKLAQLMLTSKEKSRLEDATQRVQQLLNNAPDDPDALNTLALAEYLLGKGDDAGFHLTQALEKAPHSLTPGFNLVRLKLNQKDFAGAEVTLKGIVAQNPQSGSALYSMAEFYVLTRRTAEAKEWFTKALAVDGKNGAALVGLADLLQVSGETSRAEQLYQRASALPDPEFRPAHAIFLYKSGKREQAIKEFEGLYQQNPLDRTARARLIAAYRSVGRTTDVERIWQQALKKSPHDIDALLERSQSNLRAGKIADAMLDLNTVLHLEPQSAEAHYLISIVHQMRGEQLQERRQLAEAVRNKPDFLQARLALTKLLIAMNTAQSALAVLDETPHFQQSILAVIEYRCWAQLAMGNRAAARKAIDRMVAAAPTRNVLLLDAASRLAEGDPLKARKSAAQVLAQNPEDAAALNLLMQTYSQQHQVNAGIQAVQRIAEKRPSSVPIRYVLAQSMQQLGMRDEARRELQAIRGLNPQFVPAVVDLALIDIGNGNSEEAARTLETLTGPQAQGVKVQLLKGVVEQSRNNYAEAIGNYRKALESDPGNMMALNNLAFILTEYANAPEEALGFAQKAVEVAPDNPAVQDTIGWVLYKKGLYSEAIKYLEQAAAKRSDAIMKLHLGSVYLKTGDRDRGLRLLRAAIASDPKISQSKVFKEITAGSSIR